jgi:hypothetical protein
MEYFLDVGSLSSLTSCSEGFFMKNCFAFHLDTMDFWSWTFGFVFRLALFSAHLAYGRNACSLLQFSSMLGETCGRASMEFE